ncbi:MAG: hypothetical protein IT342_11675 [Candidatus Melainabacteria bacterium]|nr:hypothetical protein [Candidatus Melainabacteria bacterium]
MFSTFLADINSIVELITSAWPSLWTMPPEPLFPKSIDLTEPKFAYSIDWNDIRLDEMDGFERSDVESLAKYISECTKYELSTEQTDVVEGESAIKAYYHHSGLPEPKIVWCESPFELILTAAGQLQECGNWLDNPQASALAKTRRQLEALAARIHVPLENALHEGILQCSYILLREALSVVPLRMNHFLTLNSPQISKAARKIAARKRLSGYHSSFSAAVQSLAIALSKNACRNRFMAIHKFLRIERGLFQETSLFALELDIRMCAGWFLFFEKIAFVCKKPVSISINERGSLSNLAGGAWCYPDGWSVYAPSGLGNPDTNINAPNQITTVDIEGNSWQMRNILIERFGSTRYQTLQKIKSLANGEARTALLEEFGLTNYWSACGAKKTQEDSYGALFRILPDTHTSLVRVINSTPEPDGIFKEYFLKVPANMSTAKEAVAWTFGLQPQEYSPDVES